MVTEDEWLSLASFRINPNSEKPEIYTLIICRDVDYPVLLDKQIVFFNKKELSSKALELCSLEVQRLGPAPQEVDLVVDLAESLYLISNEDIDTTSTILDCLNTLIDLVKAAQIPIPEHYKNSLYAFADHLTFEQEFSSFFVNHSVNRSAILDGILWCVGAVFIQSILLTD
ncbi:MAG: hypothetical protein NW224_09690 [Leptolyngbyaceae cyanobacterium bins.302]|nr:hypothetical protein [Leptolyngbyaceae cyanobacterium bins.302]